MNMKNMISKQTQLTLFALLLTLFAGVSGSFAQPGPSFSMSYEFFPTSELADPDPGTFEESLGIRVATFSAEFSLAPVMYADGKTILVNTLSFHRFDLDYDNWDDVVGGNRIENTQGIEYTLMVIRQLSEKWSLTAMINPGLYSDFQGDLSPNDFNLSSAFIFGRQYSENFSLGFGLAYTLKYGSAIPIPFVTMNWTNGSNLRVELFLPMMAELWYMPSEKLELGLTAKVSGNQYHGDPSRYAGADPQMSYSVVTAGPSVKYQFSKGFALRVDAGATLLRRFEFYDGDVKLNSLDLKESGFIRAGIQIGG
jgi:hypothetical protein